jgi:hypothetical protein
MKIDDSDEYLTHHNPSVQGSLPRRRSEHKSNICTEFKRCAELSTIIPVRFELKHYVNLAGRIPTVLLNDADAAIVAEVWGNDSKDVYRSAKNIAMITIGTGLRFDIQAHLLYTTLTFVYSLQSYG